MFEGLCEDPPSIEGDPAVYSAWLHEMDALWRQTLRTPTEESAGWVAAARAAGRLENRGAAAQLVTIGQLFAYRLRRHGENEKWCIDTMEGVTAEVAAGLGISQSRAHTKLVLARAMRERLPRVAAVFCAGDIDYVKFAVIVSRTSLITEAQVMARVDRVIGHQLTRWPSLTPTRLANKVDAIVAEVDRDAVRRREPRHRGRHLDIEPEHEGLCPVQGQLRPTDARALDQSLAALAATVCGHDPRTLAQRRADAIEALTARATQMVCLCGRSDCAAGQKPPASPVLIHVIAPQDALTGGPGAAALLGAEGLITDELLAELAQSARRVPLIHPGYAAPEPHYRPSTALADFVRCRDLTCRWPGCEVPAMRCELDHTIPWSQGGPTHAGNLKCYCPTHHLVKTFWGWREKQLADGTLILTSPSGDTYVTTPGSALLFPSLCHAVGGMPAPETTPPQDYCGQRSAMMPKRRRTRAQDRAHRVAAERRANHQARTTAHTDRSASSEWTDWGGPAPPDSDPPPF